MADLTTKGAKLPIVPFLKLPAGEAPYLEGQACSACGAIFLGERISCAKCGADGTMKAKKLSNHGELYVYSIVFRSFPGIDVPYVSAIVDLEGGGTVKGNLNNVGFDPEKIPMGMPVEVVYSTAPRKDAEGNEYMMYSFQPRV